MPYRHGLQFRKAILTGLSLYKGILQGVYIGPENLSYEDRLDRLDRLNLKFVESRRIQLDQILFCKVCNRFVNMDM